MTAVSADVVNDEAKPLLEADLAASLSQLGRDENFRARLMQKLRGIYSNSKLFAFHVDTDSATIDSHGHVFASGEALISVPTKSRKGRSVDASLSIPIKLDGLESSDDPVRQIVIQVAPLQAHYPPDLAQRLAASPSPRRSRAAARRQSGPPQNQSPAPPAS